MIGPADYAFCVAPMLDWTDRHCRRIHRLLTSRARLYTEMVTTGALRARMAAEGLLRGAAGSLLGMPLRARTLLGPGPSNPYPEATVALGRPLLGHLDPATVRAIR